MGEIFNSLMYVEVNSKHFLQKLQQCISVSFFHFFIFLYFFSLNKTSTMCVKVCPRRQVLHEICMSMYITYYKYFIFVIIVYFIFLFLFYKMKK